MKFDKKIKKLVLVLFFLNVSLLGFKTTVFGQAQDFNFSGNSRESYQCFDENNDEVEPTNTRDTTGRWLCPCRDGSIPSSLTGRCGPAGDLCDSGEFPGDPGCFAEQAVLRPPKLQQLEIWFVRILYVIWAFIGGLSFFYLVLLGYRYMISRGDVTKITEIRQKILYYFIGFILVFLAVPILTTVFRLIGINNNVNCYNVEMPAFQFFFADLCTSPIGIDDPCTIVPGNACSSDLAGRVTSTCSATGVRYVCDRTQLIWRVR
jgi:hypothetical protein